MNDRELRTGDTYDDDDIIKDDQYELLEEHGDEEYTPDQESEETISKKGTEPTRKELPNLRDSTWKTREEVGKYAEDEREVPREDVLGPEEEKDTQRRLSSLIAASHRQGRTPDERRKSAEEASKLHVKLTGYPLAIDEEGRVLAGEPVMK
ncbi:hypothetical protein HK102_004630 [Quaeritorhiza haematococci]|nr:hypothetical protein HK102_004630 [Quaeritorhiza haematococci]